MENGVRSDRHRGSHALQTTAAPLDETWNLTDLFADDEAFERSKREFKESLLPAVDRYRGRLFESPSTLADALESDSRTLEHLQMLHCYAALKSDQDIRVPTMHQTHRFAYAEDELVQVISLPYEGRDLEMVIILPRKNESLAAIERDLGSEKLATWTDSMTEKNVRLFLPKN